jgi:hypothetical protein
LPSSFFACAQKEVTMKRIIRNRRLTADEAAQYQTIRKQVADELPELVARHQERMASLDQLEKLFNQLKAAREAKGLSLADVTELTGMDRSALSKLETGQRANPNGRNARPLCGSGRETSRRYSDGCNDQLAVVAVTHRCDSSASPAVLGGEECSVLSNPLDL